jgi:hypothetical protein
MPELGRTPPGGGPEGVDSSAYEERIAQLERVIAEKEHAVLRAVLSATEVQQQLETSRAETRTLTAQLELAREKAAPASIGEDFNRISEQFAQARKSLDRERVQSQAEAVAVRARWQQAKRELDHERQMRRADGAAHNARVASLQRDLAGAQAQAPEPAPGAPRSVWALLASCALAGALLVGLYVGWLRFSSMEGGSSSRPTPPRPEFGGAPSANSPPVSGRSPDRASGRMGPKQRESEMTDKELRLRLDSVDPAVCRFQWTGGQPAVLYPGNGSLAVTLSRCAQAIGNARAQ